MLSDAERAAHSRAPLIVYSLQIVRGQVEKGTLPSLAEYLEAAAKRKQEKKTAPFVPSMRNLMSTAVH